MLSLCQCLLRPPQCSGERWYAVVLANIPSIFSYSFPFSFLPRYLTPSHSVSVFLSVPPASAPPPADRQTTTYAHTSNMLLFQSHPWKSAPEKAWISHQIRGVFFFLFFSRSCYLPCPGSCTVLLLFFYLHKYFHTFSCSSSYVLFLSPPVLACFHHFSPHSSHCPLHPEFFSVISAFTRCSTDVPFLCRNLTANVLAQRGFPLHFICSWSKE